MSGASPVVIQLEPRYNFVMSEGSLENNDQGINLKDSIKVGEALPEPVLEAKSPEDRRWLGINGQQDNVDVYFNNQTFSTLTSDLQQRGSINEAAGVLFGKRYQDLDTNKPSIKVDEYIPFPDNLVKASRAHITMTTDAWSYASEELKKRGDPNLIIVGWAHSHPGYGIFLSPADDVVNSIFPSNNIAVVFDPTLRENRLGIFSQGGSVQSNEVGNHRVEFGNNFRLHHGFYLFGQGNERVNPNREKSSGTTLENLISVEGSEGIPFDKKIQIGNSREIPLEERINIGPSVIEVRKSDIYGTGILAKIKMVMEKLKIKVTELFK